MKFNKLTHIERKSLPETYGVPVNDKYTESYHAIRQNQDISYNVANYDDITCELKDALNIGLENYGSNRGSYEICRILRGNNNMNKITLIWQLYCGEVANEHDKAKIAKAWKSYTPEERRVITGQLTDYLDHCLEYLQESFQ